MASWTADDRRAVDHYRRARAAGSDTDYRAADWRLLRTWFGGVCLACGGTPVTVDHVMPLSQGGSNTLRNLQPLCRRCNARKGGQIVDYRDPRLLVQVLTMLDG